MKMTAAVLSTALLLLSGVSTDGDLHEAQATPFTLVVISPSKPRETYNISVPIRSCLIGGMRKIRDSGDDFTFTYKDNYYYGPFLLSVNGLYNTDTEFWLLKVKKPDGTIITPDVGIGCYIPCARDEVRLEYSHVKENNQHPSDYHGEL